MRLATTRERLDRVFQLSTPSAVQGCCLETVTRAMEMGERTALTCRMCSNRLTPGTPILDPNEMAGSLVIGKAPGDRVDLVVRGVLVSEHEDWDDAAPAIPHLGEDAPAEDRHLVRLLREVELDVPVNRHALPQFGGASRPVYYSVASDWNEHTAHAPPNGHHYFLSLSNGVTIWVDKVEEVTGVS